MHEAGHDGGLTEATATVALGIRAATAYGRTDLAARLSAAQRRLEGQAAQVLVVGEYKKGKSSLVNALLGVDVCPVDDDVATSAPTIIGWSPALVAEALVRDGDDGELRRQPVGADGLGEWVSESGNPANRRGVVSVTVGLPSPLLADGIRLVDTPGAGGLSGPLSALTVAAVPLADAVIFVSDASQELTAAELGFLRSMAALCPQVLFVEAKTDMYGSWREIAALDRSHLADAGVEVPVVAMSAPLRRLAMDLGDDDLDDESGAPAVVDWLLDCVGPGNERMTAAVALAEVAEVARLLRLQFEAERSALVAPGSAPELIDRLGQAKELADRVHGVSGRWSQVLADAFADLTSDVDHDLRERLRAVTARADEAADSIDPASAWGEQERRLYEDTARSVAEHSTLRHERLVEATARVCEVFGEDHDAGISAALDTSGLGAVLDAKASLDVSSPGVGAQALTLVRSTSGGLMMIAVLGGFAGLAVAAPVMVGVSLMLGGKGLRDERQRQLAQRRALAKASIHRYVDEVSFVLGKESRDGLRHAQRALREHFAARASELRRSAADALAAAQAAERTEGEARSRRLAEVEAELRRIDALARRARIQESVGG